MLPALQEVSRWIWVFLSSSKFLAKLKEIMKDKSRTGNINVYEKKQLVISWNERKEIDKIYCSMLLTDKHWWIKCSYSLCSYRCKVQVKFLISCSNITNQCEFSGSSQEENDCIYAHSVDELEEWKERHQYRLMKLDKARQEKLFSWLNDLENKRASSEEPDAVDVVRILVHACQLLSMPCRNIYGGK